METKYKIHVGYILAILITIIVVLVSVEWSQVPDLVDYITFALTLSSLLLALLAIVYSIYSNTSISGSLDKISTAAMDVTRASSEISASNKELKSEIGQLPSRLDTLDEGLTHTRNAIQVMSDYQEAVVNASPVVSALTQAPSPDNQFIINYMQLSSLRGLQLLLMATFSARKNEIFDIQNFLDENESYRGTYDYLLAYWVASASAGIISTAPNNIVVNVVVAENIEAEVKARVIMQSRELAKFLKKDNASATIEAGLSELQMIANHFDVDMDLSY